MKLNMHTWNLPTTRTRCEICSKLLLTLNIFHTSYSRVSIVNFGKVSVGWVDSYFNLL